MMIIFEVMDRLEINSYVMALYNKLEVGFDAVVFAAMAWAGPLALREMKRQQATMFVLDSRTQVEVTDPIRIASGH